MFRCEANCTKYTDKVLVEDGPGYHDPSTTDQAITSELFPNGIQGVTIHTGTYIRVHSKTC